MLKLKMVHLIKKNLYSDNKFEFIMKKFLILGSNSFAGFSFCKFLLKSKKNKIIGLSRSFSKEKNNILRKIQNNSYSFFQLDLNKDVNTIIDLIKKKKPDYIINFIAQGMVNESWDRPIDWYQTNLLSLVRLCEGIKKMKFIKKFIHFSTPEVYGSTKHFLKENFLFKPSTPYASSRASAELYLLNIYKENNFPVIFTRAANIYGPDQQLYRIIPKAIIKLLKNEKIYLDGNGASKRSFIYMDDVSSALIKIIDKGIIGKCYHISTNQIISIYSLVSNIARILNKEKKLIVKLKKDRRGKDKLYSLSSSLIRKNFDWRPSYNLKQGLTVTINSIIKNFKNIKNKQLKYVHKV